MTEIIIEPLDRPTATVADPLAGEAPRDLSGFAL